MNAGNEIAASPAGHGRLRASHADREQVIDALKVAFVQDRLTKDDFEARLGQAFTSRTYAELSAVTADIPAGRTGAQSPRQVVPAQARSPVNRDVKSGVCAIVLVIAMWVAVFLTDNAAVFMVAVVVTIAVFLASPLAGSLILDSGRKKRPGRRPPPLPAPSPKFNRGPA